MDAVRSEMKENGLDALVVAGAPDIRFRGRIFYLTDYWQLLADSHVVITMDEGPIYVGNLVWGLSQAKQSDWITEFRISGKPGIEVADVLSKRGLDKARVGLVGLSDGAFAHQHVEDLRKSLSGVNLVDATEMFERVRQVNSEEELANLGKASATRRSVFDELRKYIRPGATEREVAAQGHRISREHGLRDPMVLVWSTPFIGATSFGEPRPIGKDSVVTVWIESPDENGYWLEYRECYSFGPPTSEYTDYWQLYTSALNAGLDKLRPGNMASEFAIAVQEVMATGGYKVDFPDPGYQHQQYSLHGIGSDAIQGVWTPGQDRGLAHNEMVNVHPVIVQQTPELVAKFDVFGVTDNVLVTPEGGKWATHDQNITRGFTEL
ncbi:Xaa-Pro aminopeptidase [Paramicrobacterium humi]|uniref:Xaa-Pro aminopeptidase n=2 Tax=Paramicrobacterium humi TaxID=640635 RepID=A0A1H4K8V2_9MICO|nr:Xaa-Pro aminopeptidase [Microbacterium humi]